MEDSVVGPRDDLDGKAIGSEVGEGGGRGLEFLRFGLLGSDFLLGGVTPIGNFSFPLRHGWAGCSMLLMQELQLAVMV